MVRLTDRPNMTIAVDWEVKPETKQTKKLYSICLSVCLSMVSLKKKTQ